MSKAVSPDSDSGRPWAVLASAIAEAVAGDTGIERPVETGSRLGQELAECRSDTAKYFLGQLNHHCSMLAVGMSDAVEGLHRLDRDLPFSAVVVVRGLVEAAADLHWLAEPRIEVTERVRRTFLVFLIQLESQVRQLENFAERYPQERPEEFGKAISEGWEALLLHAEEMASAGYELRTSRRAGKPTYSVGDPKPSTTQLVDDVVSEFYGQTGINLYKAYSPVAHAEGGGLANLLSFSDAVETPDGPRYRYGMDDEMWMAQVAYPGLVCAMGSMTEWLRLSLPDKLSTFVARTTSVSDLLRDWRVRLNARAPGSR